MGVVRGRVGGEAIDPVDEGGQDLDEGLEGQLPQRGARGRGRGAGEPKWPWQWGPGWV